MKKQQTLPLVNRQVVILRPKKPFIDWANECSKEGADFLSLDQVRNHASAILIPDFDFREDALEFIDVNFEELFLQELQGWSTDPKDWPQDMCEEMFHAWFDVEIHEMVFDIGDEELEVDE